LGKGNFFVHEPIFPVFAFKVMYKATLNGTTPRWPSDIMHCMHKEHFPVVACVQETTYREWQSAIREITRKKATKKKVCFASKH